MKVAVLGATHWHIPCYDNPVMKLGHQVVLFDEDGERIRQRAQAKGFQWHADYRALDDVRPDFAFCLGRHDQMAGLIELCVDRRIPFLAEKPGAPDAPTLRRLAQRCDELKLFNAGPFCLRWDPAALRVKELLDSGTLGRVARIHAAYLGGAIQRYANWGCPWMLNKDKALGGSIYNEAVHAIDLLRFWGFEQTYRAGRASFNINRGEVDDVISMLLDCGDAYAVVESGYLVQNPYGGMSYTLFCENANIDYAKKKLTVTWTDGRQETFDNPNPEGRDGMVAELLDLAAAGKPAPSTLHDMVATLVICDAFKNDPARKDGQ